MLNIKEIALKHAREYLTFKLGGRKGLDVEEIVCDDEIYKEIVNELAQQFEALIDEIAKQNEPVAWWHETDEGLFCVNTLPPTGQIGWKTKPLYTLPPTAEQIANETAEAIAEMVEFDTIDPEAIRNGAWREFKK